MPSCTFHKEERLKSRKIISGLFKNGRSLSAYPLKVIWNEVPVPHPGYPFQFALTVPKRSFPKATQRNRIRRQIREAFRLNKHMLYEQLPALTYDRQKDTRQYAIMVIYVAKEALPYQSIEEATQKWIGIFIKKLLKES